MLNRWLQRKPTAKHKRAFGEAIETEVVQFLLKKGLILKERNFYCRLGEIDLIMEDGDHLVFVEVRYRASSKFGSPLESIDARKQHKIRLAAESYLQRFKNRPPQCRFDAVGVTGKQDKRVIDWVKGAF